MPVLAGVWPAVRIGINNYNKAVTDSKDALMAASERLEFVSLSVKGEADISNQVNQILVALNKSIDSILADYSLQTITDTGLPEVWALAFFASLTATIGHLIYQVQAPSLIRRITAREFVAEQRERYTNTPTTIQLLVAMTNMDDSNSNNKLEKGKLARASEALANEFRLSDLCDPKQKLMNEARLINEITPEFLLKVVNISRVDSGATEIYSRFSEEKPHYAMASRWLYYTSLTLILIITLMQIHSVSIASLSWYSNLSS